MEQTRLCFLANCMINVDIMNKHIVACPSEKCPLPSLFILVRRKEKKTNPIFSFPLFILVRSRDNICGFGGGLFFPMDLKDFHSFFFLNLFLPVCV